MNRIHPAPYEGPAPGSLSDALACAEEAKEAAAANAAAIAALLPDTNPFPTALTLAVVDGVLTATVTLNEGDPLTGTATLPDDISVNSGTFAVDAACQVTLPKSDGTSVVLDLCDLVSEMTAVVNADGSTTVTHSAGGEDVSFTIPAPIDCELVCNGNTIEFLKDGVSAGRIAIDRVEPKLGAVNVLTDQTAAANDIYVEPVCRNIDLGDCGGRITATAFISYNRTVANGGVVIFVPEISYDGIVWGSMGTNGVDVIPLGDTGEVQVTALTQTGVRTGVQTICMRVRVFANASTGPFQLKASSQTFVFATTECREC